MYPRGTCLLKGIPSLDFHVGGGVAVGTLIVIEEDAFGSFANLMLRYFVAEGEEVGSRHSNVCLYTKGCLIASSR